MGKKTAKPNAFSTFMYEFIAKERAAGRFYPKEKFSEVAAPHWEKLSEDEKAKYKVLATGSQGTVVERPKYTSQGELVSDIEKREREKVEKKVHMEMTVKRMIGSAFLNNELGEMPMHFIMANYFYKYNSQFVPAEIAVGKFTFTEGIINTYDTKVNPGAMTTGYAYEARAHSERTHRLTPPPSAMGECDFQQIYGRILDVLDIEHEAQFAKGDENRPNVFCREEDAQMIESILDTISDRKWRNKFDVFHLETFFNNLVNITGLGNERLPISITNHFIESDPYDLTPDIACDFHEKNDAPQYCAASFLYRWFYVMTDKVAAHIGVELVPGKNLPKNIVLSEDSANFTWD